MFTVLRNSVFVFTLAAGAFASTEEDFSRQVDVTSGGKLIVDVDFGTIDLSGTADNKVVIEAHREVDVHDASREKQYLADAPITVTNEGNVVTVRARNAKSKHFGGFGHSRMDAQYTLHVPKKFEADLHTNGGAISVTDISANTRANTSGGKMLFSRLEGALEGKTSGGSIKVEDCRGAIEIKTSGGDVTIANGNGALHAVTSGGRVDVQNFSGDTDVRTSGGNLILERITGKIKGRTSGGSIQASIPGSVTGDVNLETSAGNIELGLPMHAALDIDAHTSIGKVINRLPLEVSQHDDEHLRGKLNGGGKSVTLGTSAGNITLKPASELALR